MKCIIKPFSGSLYSRLLTVQWMHIFFAGVVANLQTLGILWNCARAFTGYRKPFKVTTAASYSVSTQLLTLGNEVDVGNAGLVIGLKGASVGPLVGYLHLVDVDWEVTAVTVGQCHTLVQRPLVCPCEQDVRAVQPGLVGHLLVDPTSRGGGAGIDEQVRGWFHTRLWLIWHTAERCFIVCADYMLVAPILKVCLCTVLRIHEPPEMLQCTPPKKYQFDYGGK